MNPPATREAFAERALASAARAVLPPLWPIAVVVLSAFALFAFVDTPPRPIVGALDFLVVVFAAGAWVVTRRTQVSGPTASALASVVGCLVAFTTLVRFAQGGERICAIHTILLILAFGSLSVSRRWFVAAVATIFVAWLVLSVRWMSGRTYLEHALALFAASALSTVFFATRLRSLLHDAEFAWRDEEGRRRLESALADAHRELVDRERAESEREELRGQLLHAQKMEAIGTLAGGVAHDMNNMLAAISSLAEVLRNELPSSSPHHDDADQILEAARRGADLTRNLLAFSRKGKYREEEVYLDAVVEDVARLLGRTLPKETSVAVSLGHGDAYVLGDSNQLSHALLNLCINASDAMPGGGMIQIATARVALDDVAAKRLGVTRGEYVNVRVVDRGTGMTAETKSRLFEPFFTTKPPGRGTGLGMPMVYGTMQSHDGAVDVESTLGKGTTVSWYLPLRGVRAPPVHAASERPRSGRGTILVIDDERLVRTAATRVLEKLGYRVVAVDGGTEGVRVYARDHAMIDLILLDMAMPTMNGPECFRLLREIDPRATIVISSGYAHSHDTQRLLDAGAAGFIEKPYGVAALGALLERVLAESSS